MGLICSAGVAAQRGAKVNRFVAALPLSFCSLGLVVALPLAGTVDQESLVNNSNV